jgi:hypothetical protein
MTSKVELKEATLNGKLVAYTSKTEFLVQVGKEGSKYSTRYRFEGDLHNAVFYYKSINIGNGYKKRLIAPSFNKPLIARAFS